MTIDKKKYLNLKRQQAAEISLCLVLPTFVIDFLEAVHCQRCTDLNWFMHMFVIIYKSAISSDILCFLKDTDK